jgi:hypothetical protein
MRFAETTISPARARCTRRSAMLTQSPKATYCCAPGGPAMPSTASPRCAPSAIAAGNPYSVCQRSPIGGNSCCAACAATTASAAAVKTPSTESFCTARTLPLCAVIWRATSAKNSLASSMTLAGSSTSESRVKLRSSA